jgi:hypothetical protein
VKHGCRFSTQNAARGISRRCSPIRRLHTVSDVPTTGSCFTMTTITILRGNTP